MTMQACVALARQGPPSAASLVPARLKTTTPESYRKERYWDNAVVGQNSVFCLPTGVQHCAN